jgi:lipoprotein-anchoring transpeptidase ErfK/SrfK
MARLATLAIVVACTAAACGSERPAERGAVLAVHAQRCKAGTLRALGSPRLAYVAAAPHGVVARRRPGGPVVARFGGKNVNGYPTVFGVLGAVVDRNCKARWYRVQLPVKPNGATGFVSARPLELQTVRSRIVVDVSERRLTLLESGKPKLVARVAVGTPETPTPTGRYYVNQRLVPTDPSGPFGPGAVGISAFSNVLTGWTQGGPVAIHGTNEPWSIGRAASNGCIRLPNATLEKVFAAALAGTPVIITA